MASSIATAFVEIRSDSRRGKEEVKADAKAMAQEATKTLAQFFSAAVVVNEFRKVIGAASRLEQAVGGSAAVFGRFQTEIDAAARTSARAMGLSEAAFRELTSQIGGLLQGLGFTQDEAAKTSISMAQLGADLAATFGGRPEEAVAALGAALRGEFDPLERFGVSLNVTQANLKAVEMGLATSTSQVDLNARAQASLAIIAERSAMAQGQFGREADTAAGRTAIMSAEFENARAKLGNALLPTFVTAVELLGTLVGAFSSLPAPVQTAVVAMIGLVALAGPLKNFVGIAKMLGPAIMSANPAFLALGAGVAVLAGVMVAFQQRANSNAEAVNGLADAMRNASSEAEGLTNWLNQVIGEFAPLTGVLDAAGVSTQDVTDAALAGGQAWEDMAAKLNAANEASGEADIVQKAVRNSIANLPGVITEAADKADMMGRVLSNTADSAEDLGDKSGDLAVEMGTIERGAADARSEFGRLDDAVQRLSDAFDDIIGRSMDLDDAQQNLFETAAALTDAIADNGVTLDVMTEAGRKNRDAVKDATTAILENATALVRSGRSNEEAARAVETQRQALIDQMTQAGFTRAEVEAYLEQLGLTPENVTTSIELAGVEAQKARIDEAIAKLGEIPAAKATELQTLIDQGSYDQAEALLRLLARNRQAFVSVSTVTGGRIVRSGDPQVALASGGLVTQATNALVGEAGAEAVLPLTRPSRLAALLDDERIRGPVVDALGATAGSSGGGMAPGTPVVMILDGRPIKGMIVEHEAAQVAALNAGMR